MHRARVVVRSQLQAARRNKSTTAESKVVSSGGGIRDIPKDYPFLFQLGVATAKTSAADLVCQVG